MFYLFCFIIQCYISTSNNLNIISKILFTENINFKDYIYFSSLRIFSNDYNDFIHFFKIHILKQNIYIS